MRWTSSYLPVSQYDPTQHYELSRLPTLKRSLFRQSFRAIAIISVLLSVLLVLHYLENFSADDVAVYTGSSPPGTPDGWYYYSHLATFESPLVNASESRPYRTTRPQRVIGYHCAERWIARGDVCASMPDSMARKAASGDDGRIDILWTWINGSDPFLGDLRANAAVEDAPETAQADKDEAKSSAGVAEHHFRDHDELRYSMRSVYQNVPKDLIRKLHLFTSSLPFYSNNDTVDVAGLQTHGRMGHVPTWLYLAKNDVEQPTINIVHHWEAFKVTDRVLSDLGYPSGNEGAEDWRRHYLPTFNSLTIESQFPHIEELKDTLLYLNDDYFITRPMTSGDFATALYGPVFRIQRTWGIGHIDTQGWYSYKGDMEGELPTLELSNWYLNDRFGGRRRSYIQHVARSMDVTVMRELNYVWPDVLASSASVRFRAHEPQIHIAFLQMYYHIEKHREALLYSFLVLRADQNQDGRLTPSEARAMLDELSGKTDFKPGQNIVVPTPRRRNPYTENLLKASLEVPAETKYSFTSADGYPFVPKTQRDKEWADFTVDGPAEMCRMTWDTCFFDTLGEQEVSTQDLFKRWMFSDPTCGDCAILALLGQSGDEGLDAFLPRPNEVEESDADVDSLMEHYDLVGGDTAKWWEGSFDPTAAMRRNPRAFAVRNIQRYSYVIGDTPTAWLQVKDTSVGKRLDRLKDPNNKVALLAINDDVKDGAEMEPTDRLLKGWYRARWRRVVGWWERPMPRDGWWRRKAVEAPRTQRHKRDIEIVRKAEETEDDCEEAPEERRRRRLGRGHGPTS